MLTLHILSHASGNKYSELKILEHTDFVVTDSTAQNKGVIKEVYKELVAVIKECLLVNTGFCNESLFDKVMHCLTGFIGNKFSAKY